MNDIQPVVLCGGSGLRLWPESREQKPEEFVALFNGVSPIANALRCITEITNHLPPLFICQASHEDMLFEHLQALGVDDFSIMVAPLQLGKTLAIYLAAKWVQKRYKETTMVVLAADQYGADPYLFADVLSQASVSSALGGIVCVGARPEKVTSECGFIKLGDIKAVSMMAVEFVEQADLVANGQPVVSDEYLCNTGVFVADSNILLSEYEALVPEIVMHGQSIFSKIISQANIHYVAEKAYLGCPSGHFNKMILAKTNRAEVIAYKGQWSDMGNWASIWQALDKDGNNNAIAGSSYTKFCHNSLILSKSKPVVAIGLAEMIVVDTEDATLVAHADYAHEVKHMVADLTADGFSQAHEIRLATRPWGQYEILQVRPGSKIKQLTVNPGAKLSLQRHAYRSEDWMVISGQALVTCDDFKGLLGAGESIGIPKGAMHRLENPGLEPLIVIEVQAGDYLGEDDIERFEDIYARRCK